MLGALNSIKDKVLQGVSDVVDAVDGSSDKDSKKSEETKSGDFDSFLKSLISPDAENNVSEEELFAALISERIAKLKGDEVGTKFTEALGANKATMRGADGFVPCEDAAKAALKTLVSDGSLTKEEANKIYSEAFSAAQLDANTSALFDSRGGAGDATIAVQKLEAALLASRVKMEKFDSGDETAEKRDLNEASNSKTSTSTVSAALGTTSGSGADTTTEGSDPFAVELAMETPNGTVLDGANGFLFKPVSENQGTLAVLLPEVMAHQVSSLILKDKTGNVIEEGRSTGYGDLGTREKFSFSKPGGSYQNDLTVEVRFANGSVKQYQIPNPALRYD